MIEPSNPSSKIWDLLGFQATSFGLRQKLGLVQKHVLIFVQSRHSLDPLRFRLGRCHEISGFERTTSAFTHPKTLQDRHNSLSHGIIPIELAASNRSVVVANAACEHQHQRMYHLDMGQMYQETCDVNPTMEMNEGPKVNNILCLK
jgi:hypothetical protein